MRTQQEILQRFQEVEDFLGIQKVDLIAYLEFEFAKPYLREETIKKIESGEEKWEVFTDPKKEILGYLDFAYEKAENQRGISAARSMLHFRTWIWLDDEEFYNKVIGLIDNYTNYGIPALDMISQHYNYTKS